MGRCNNALEARIKALEERLDEFTGTQELALNDSQLEITGGNSVDLSKFLDNTDSQVIAGSLNGTSLEFQISNGNTIQIPLDSLATDEQMLLISNNQLQISGGNSVDLTPYINTDSQTLSIDGSTLSISGGNSVEIPLREARAIYQATGRAYLYSSRWAGLSETYGYEYYQWNVSKGGGANPAYSVQKEQGFLATGSGVVKKIRWVVERSSTAVYDAWVDVAIIRNGTVVPVGRVTSTDNSAQNRIYTTATNVAVQENDIITWAFRKSAGGLSYGYSIISIEIQ